MYMVEVKMLPIRCAGMSLVGIGPRRPTSWGNYFSLYYAADTQPPVHDLDYDRVRILNMWWENLEALTRPHNSFLAASIQNGAVEVKIYTDPETKYRWGIVIDKRVPPEYLYNKLCFTGGRMPTEEIARDIYNILGDPNNEIEQYTDPVAYYEKRGAKYDPEKGIITWYPKMKKELDDATN